MEKQHIHTEFAIYTFGELPEIFQQLILKAQEQTQKAYAPYSNFAVGAAVLLENGEVFAGSNQENAAYPSGLCAERVALFYANAQYPEVPVKALAVAAKANGDFAATPVSPCGACRQVMLETETRFAQPITLLLHGKEQTYVFDSVTTLLPLSFTETNLKN
jgi:cytidine deaminase